MALFTERPYQRGTDLGVVLDDEHLWHVCTVTRAGTARLPRDAPYLRLNPVLSVDRGMMAA
jgi:hypothetical protein